MGAEAVPSVRLDRLGFPSYWAPMQTSHLDIRDVRPRGATIPRHEEPGFLERMAERERLDREARLRLRIPDPQVRPHDDQVDALTYALNATATRELPAGFTRHPMVGFERIRDDQAFRQEYQGTFRSEEVEGEMVVNPRAIELLQQQLQRSPADAQVDAARREIQEDLDRDILDILRRQDEALRLQPMPLTMERPDEGLEFRLNTHAQYGSVQPMHRVPNFGPPTPRPPELTVKRAEPEPVRRSRFARIDDD
jgi:hypothetical protein